MVQFQSRQVATDNRQLYLASMPKHPKRPRDLNELAKHIGDVATGQAPDDAAPSPNSVRAAKGGEARAKSLSRSRRVAIARKGGKAAQKRRRA